MNYIFENFLYFYIGSALVFILPRSLSLIIAQKIAGLVYFFDRKLKNTLRKNLLPVLSYNNRQDELDYFLRKTIGNFAERTVDYLRLLWIKPGDIERLINCFSGEVRLKDALSKGKGVILTCPHLGHFILGAALLVSKGYKVSVIAGRSKKPVLHRWRNGLRKKVGIKVINISPGGTTTVEIIKALKNGEIVCMLADRKRTGHNADTLFFKRKVSFPVGPVIISKRSKAPILAAYAVKSKECNLYDVIIEEPLSFEKNKNEDMVISDYLDEITRIFERLISTYPDQWYNFFDFWAYGKV